MKLSVIIVNHNTVNLLRDCLNNLKGIYSSYEIIVVDNGSTDGSVQMVKEEFSKDKTVTLVENENKGIANANNLGLQKASGQYILHLGTDAYPKTHIIKEMINYMERNPEVGITTARLVMRDGSPDMDAHRGFPTPWAAITHFLRINKLFKTSRVFNRYFLGWEDLMSIHEIDLCISHFMLVRKNVYDNVGLWDDSFFVFGEDVDFCYRVKQKGWKIVYMGNLEVLHYKGAGVGRKSSADLKTASSSSFETRLRMKKATTQAMRLFYKKHFSQKYPYVFVVPVFIAISILEFVRTRRS